MASEGELSIQVEDASKWDAPEGQVGQGMLLHTTGGDIQSIIHHNAENSTQKAIVWVCGASGGFGGPGDGVYSTLAEELKGSITSLRMDYRYPNALPECVMDTLAGVSFLKAMGHSEIVLVGHSFGGAVVIAAAPHSDEVKAVVALSSQTHGATNAKAVSPRPLLLVHGADDTRLPPHCSEMIYEWAEEPKEIVILPGAEHGLRECKDELHNLVKDWIVQKIGG